MLRWALHLDGLKRAYHAAVAVGHKVYSFGGYGMTFMSDMGQIDVHVFNTVSLRWVKLPPVTTGRGERPLDEVPSMRYGHTAALIQDNVYIWGGVVNSQPCNVLHKFAVDTHGWSKPQVPAGTVPQARYGHSACVLGRVMYIFGGYNRQTGHSNDMYKLDTSTMVWSLINTRNTPAPASQYHSATVIGTKMFVFGGRGRDVDHNNNIRVFDTVTNCWQSTVAQPLLPEGREGHSAFAYNGELYIFGGRNFLLRRTFNDLWKFNPGTFSWKRVEPKGKYPCWISRMCSCMVGERMILFGGYRYRYTDVEDLEDEDDEYVYDAEVSDLYILDPSPSLKTLSKLAVIQYDLGQSGLPYDIRWELAAMTTNDNNR